ncbi:cupin domain-containing protein [Streptomyces sp. NPDC048595]|uniref:cupin domain-containing protein n=1 Tax=Streptomyces sp. NPDC048595 TaxID=3365576 RepID=UPI003723D6E2
MNIVDIPKAAALLPDAWSSLQLAQIGHTSVKVLRMDGRPLQPESHDTAEALLVMDGHLHLIADGHDIDIRPGEMYIVEAGVVHSVRPGSTGTLLIIEQPTHTA